MPGKVSAGVREAGIFKTLAASCSVKKIPNVASPASRALLKE
jgi:hypothetical protein